VLESSTVSGNIVTKTIHNIITACSVHISSKPRLERVQDRSEQGKPWPGPPTWAAIISLDCPLGLADDYVTAKLNLQSTKVGSICLRPTKPKQPEPGPEGRRRRRIYSYSMIL
jgi:hypothetical protein